MLLYLICVAIFAALHFQNVETQAGGKGLNVQIVWKNALPKAMVTPVWDEVWH